MPFRFFVKNPQRLKNPRGENSGFGPFSRRKSAAMILLHLRAHFASTIPAVPVSARMSQLPPNETFRRFTEKSPQALRHDNIKKAPLKRGFYEARSA